MKKSLPSPKKVEINDRDKKNADWSTLPLVLQRCYNDLSGLRLAASEGDADSFKALTALARFAAEMVAGITEREPIRAREIARRMEKWPVLISASRNWPVDINVLRKSLQLGTDVMGVIDVRRAFREAKPARQIVMSLIRLIVTLRRIGGFPPNRYSWIPGFEKVPPTLLSEADSLEDAIVCHIETCEVARLLGVSGSACEEAVLELAEEAALLNPPDQDSDAWMAFAIKLLLTVVKDSEFQPAEKNLVLRNFGISAKNKYYNRIKKFGKSNDEVEQTKKRGSAHQTEESNIRAAMLSKLRGALKAVMRKEQTQKMPLPKVPSKSDSR